MTLEQRQRSIHIPGSGNDRLKYNLVHLFNGRLEGSNIMPSSAFPTIRLPPNELYFFCSENRIYRLLLSTCGGSWEEHTGHQFPFLNAR